MIWFIIGGWITTIVGMLVSAFRIIAYFYKNDLKKAFKFVMILFCFSGVANLLSILMEKML